MLQFDARITSLIFHLQMVYVATIAYCYRISSVSIYCGYTSGVIGYSLLQQLGSGILLPEFLTRYIEAIGKLVMHTSITIVPFAANYRDLFPVGTAVTLDPAEILFEVGPILENPWVIDAGWIAQWNDAVSKAFRKGMRFRTVNYDEPTGRQEMVVSYIRTTIGVVAYSPHIITEVEAHFGACYAYRDYTQREY